MGYPMTYSRLVSRNQLKGDYTAPTDERSALRGDLRRLEHDQQDEYHTRLYAQASGASEDQARVILQCFFYGFKWLPRPPVPNDPDDYLA